MKLIAALLILYRLNILRLCGLLAWWSWRLSEGYIYFILLAMIILNLRISFFIAVSFYLSSYRTKICFLINIIPGNAVWWLIIFVILPSYPSVIFYLFIYIFIIIFIFLYLFKTIIIYLCRIFFFYCFICI